MLSERSALVLFSGGQDSATCLAWALSRYDRVETVAFTYGQRHAVELQQRPILLDAFCRQFTAWAPRLADDHVIDLSYLSAIGETAMTADVAITMGENGLPTTFVPGRNLAFLTAAAALAYRRGAGVLVGGMCQTDYSGYPDCRLATLQAQQEAITLGLDQPMRIETPLMHLSKAESWTLADSLGGEELIALIEEETHTCYKGDRSHRHAWGYGCGECPACELRAAGHREWRASA